MKKIVALTAVAGLTMAMAADGKAVYAKCAGCHGANGEKHAMGNPKIPALKGQTAADLEKKIAGYKAGTLNAFGMGATMKGMVASLSDEDIKAVAEYIASMK